MFTPLEIISNLQFSVVRGSFNFQASLTDAGLRQCRRGERLYNRFQRHLSPRRRSRSNPSFDNAAPSCEWCRASTRLYRDRHATPVADSAEPPSSLLPPFCDFIASAEQHPPFARLHSSKSFTSPTSLIRILVLLCSSSHLLRV